MLGAWKSVSSKKSRRDDVCPGVWMWMKARGEAWSFLRQWFHLNQQVPPPVDMMELDENRDEDQRPIDLDARIDAKDAVGQILATANEKQKKWVRLFDEGENVRSAALRMGVYSHFGAKLIVRWRKMFAHLAPLLLLALLVGCTRPPAAQASLDALPMTVAPELHGSRHRIGPGCAHQGIVPILHAEIPRRGELCQVSIQWRSWWSGRPSALIIGASATSWAPLKQPLPLHLDFLGSPGCFLRVSVDATIPFPPDPRIALAIHERWPQTFYVQAVVIADADGTLVMSQGMRLGVRSPVAPQPSDQADSR